MENYRKLTQQEIDQLSQQHCTAEDWNAIEVDPKFNAQYVSDTHFSGPIRLGYFEKSYTLEGNITRHSGIRMATLHNCVVGNDAYIERIGNYIANYVIGNETLIENVDLLAVTEKSSFGNGVLVSPLNEGGGREVPICDVLSAHFAYMMALYRHRSILIEKLQKMVEQYSAQIVSETGHIGNNVIIRNCGCLKNLRIGDNATLKGCLKLENGSINSNASAPVNIGVGVIAKDFILSSGSEVTESAMIDKCFVGQGCQIGKQYSATDTLFFANCQGFHGEAASVFAGPFTVTHHKSSLLIAGLFSFLNAGSGSNQSNHMYKLGPIHQGILERGAKTASDSYILWPSRVGAFSLVMGRHVTHSDTSNLPFSYLIEQQNTTYLVPGVNLRSVGTIRDAQKWPKRDARKDEDKLDCINYNLLSPYTIQKMFKGIQLLKNLQYSSGELSDIYSYHSAKIRNASLKHGIKYYETAITKFLGNSLIKRLENMPAGASEERIHTLLKPTSRIGKGPWADISGLIVPRNAVSELLDQVENGGMSIEQLSDAFHKLHEDYYDAEWTWAYDKFEAFFNIPLEHITVKQIVSIVERWKEAVIGLDKELYEDARKEFNLASQTGFGADGSQEIKEKDFSEVRGDFESNSFVTAVLEHIKAKEALGNDLIARLQA